MSRFQANKAGLRPLLQIVHAWEMYSVIFLTFSYNGGVVLDDDQEVAGLFKNGRELEYCKSSPGLKVLELVVQSFSGI